MGEAFELHDIEKRRILGIPSLQRRYTAAPQQQQQHAAVDYVPIQRLSGVPIPARAQAQMQRSQAF
jgi:hypothetical protein